MCPSDVRYRGSVTDFTTVGHMASQPALAPSSAGTSSEIPRNAATAGSKLGKDWPSKVDMKLT